RPFEQLSSANSLKNAYLTARRKPFLLMWETRWRAKSWTRWEYLHFNGEMHSTSSGSSICDE
ncbi:hypothetical protein T440DRAFT_388755, partial [Plenodomus tracheiphilus IPT5]